MQNEFKNLSERLKHALKTLEISQTELAKRIDVKPQVIQYLCSGNSDRTKFMFDIAEALEIDALWLATGKGVMCSASNITIPLLAFDQVIDWKVFKKNVFFQEIKKIAIQSQISFNSFAVKLQDQSMAPRFSSDTIIVIDPDFNLADILPENRFMLVYLEKEKCVVFRLVCNYENSTKLFPLNTALHKDIFLSEQDLILGVCREARWHF